MLIPLPGIITYTKCMLVETHITLLIFSLLVYSISSKIGLVGKIRHEAISSLKEGEPSSASKIVIIAHQ
jgi:hypothetical protein